MSAEPPTSTTSIQDPEVWAARTKIATLAHLMFERRLTDAAGGNVSARVGTLVCITPRFAGSRRQWNLRAEDVLVADMEANIVEGKGDISREAKVHFRLHRDFGHLGTGVIHAHARNVLVFAATATPMPPVLEATRKFGEIPVVKYAAAHSHLLAENIAAVIAAQQARIAGHAAAAIAPYHGLFLIGRDLDAAFDAVERIDNNAYCILMGKQLMNSDLLAESRAKMEATILDFEHSEKH